MSSLGYALSVLALRHVYARSVVPPSAQLSARHAQVDPGPRPSDAWGNLGSTMVQSARRVRASPRPRETGRRGQGVPGGGRPNASSKGGVHS